MSELILLFLISFIAATIIPTGSEAVLLGLIKLGNHNNIILFLIATIGRNAWIHSKLVFRNDNT